MKTIALAAGIAALMLTTIAAAQTAPRGAQPFPNPPVRSPYGTPITLEQAEAVMAAAKAEARKRNVYGTVAIAIVEPSGELVTYIKGTSAQYAAYEFSMGKARTSARYQRSTKLLADQLATGSLQPLAFPGATVAGAGGLPIVVGGRTIGAIGTTGGFDEEVAQAGLAALK